MLTLASSQFLLDGLPRTARLAGAWVLKVDGETGDAVYEEEFEAQYL